MKLSETVEKDNRIVIPKFKSSFLLIDSNDGKELKEFKFKYLNLINKKYHNIIHIYTMNELFKNSLLSETELSLMINKLFRINEKELPVCIYLGDLQGNICTSYSLKNISSESINEIFEKTAKELKLKKIFSIKNDKMNMICEKSFNKNYAKKSTHHNKKLYGDKSIEYFFNSCIMRRTIIDDINNIYKDIELLYKKTKSIKLKREKDISSIGDNHNNLNEIYDKSDNDFLEIAALINEKNNLIDNIYKENSLLELYDEKNENLGIMPKFKDWISVEEDYDEEYESSIDIHEYDNYPIIKNDYKQYFEKKSLTMINTCEVTEKLLRSQLILDDEDIDFSVCASGYWKALEIELNIIFIDTIRKNKGIIQEIPSQGISYKKGKYEVFSGYKYYDNKKIPQMVNINKIDKGKLCSCMLGELLHISQNYSKNELDKIIYGLYLMIEKEKSVPWSKTQRNKDIDYEISVFMNSIVNETRYIVNKYRNIYSHTGVMTEEELYELKNILFKNDGLYYRIGLLKKQVNIIS